MIAPVSAVDYQGGGSFSVGRAVPVVETSDGSYLNTADFIASGCTSYVGTSANHSDGMTGAVRIALLANSFRLPGRGSWADRAHGGPVHGHSRLHILRVARHIQPGST